MAQFEIEDCRVPLLVSYTWTPLHPATRHSPEEGGVDDVQVFVQHPKDPTKNVNITGFLNQESLDHFSSLAYENGEEQEQNKQAMADDAAYDAWRDRQLERA